MSDEIGSADMIQGFNTTFIEDRFCNPYSALALNGGWAQIPSGVYFDTPEFSIVVWVYPKDIGSFSRILDFGSGPFVNNILFAFSSFSPMKPCVYLKPLYFEVLTATLLLDQWQFLAVTFNGSELRIYLNDQIILQNQTSYSFPIVNRSQCYIGKSNFPWDGYSYSYLDDFRIYNKSLSQDELIQIMNQNEENCK
jgi:hypothetical protein